MFNDKIVVRAGWGLYYDRGELFTYLSPGFASGVITGGPFGVNQTPSVGEFRKRAIRMVTGYVTCPRLRKPVGHHAGSSPFW